MTKLPSSDAREEFLIILEYLFEYAYDSKHLSSQSKIVQFAKDKYDVTIRRDRVNNILIHLSQLYKKNPQRFPFKLNVKKLNSINKYYITNRYFSDEETIDIVSAIRNDYSKSPRKIKSLENKTLNLVAGPEKRKILEDKINKIENRSGHISDKYQEILDTLKKSANEKLFVKMKFKNFYNYEISNDEDLIKKDIIEGNSLMGYIHSILSFPKETLVVFYVTSYKACLVAPVESIEVLEEPINVESWVKSIKFDIKEECKTVDKWVAKHYRGTTGKVYDLVLGIKPYQFEKIKAKYETYFDIKLQYEVGGKDKKMVILDNDKEVEVDISNKIEELYYVHLQSNLSSFTNWYLNDNEVLENVIIIYPRKVNDDILSNVIRLLNNRINNYGSEQYEFIKKNKQ